MDTEDDFFQLVLDETMARTKRHMCSNCGRPSQVCWCSHLPEPRIQCQTRVYVLQHPAELHRPLQTALMLRSGLAEGQCHIYKSRKYNAKRNLEQAGILTASNSLLLYPGPDAVPIDRIPKREGGYNLILLDGTWTEARRMYHLNEILKSMPMVMLPERGLISQFIVRRQPKDGCLSTVESAAMAIAILEDRPEVFEALTRPLVQACQFQLGYGAVVHESKERKMREKALVNGLRETGSSNNELVPSVSSPMRDSNELLP